MPLMQRTPHKRSTFNSNHRHRNSSFFSRTSSLDSGRSRNSSCSLTDAHAFFDTESGYTPAMRTTSARSTKGCHSWIFVSLMIFVLVGGYYHEQKIKKALMQEQETAMRELEIDLSAQFDTKVQKLKDEHSRIQGKLSDEEELMIRNRQLDDENHQLQTRVSEEKYHLENDLQSLKASNGQLTEQKETLQHNIQLMSKTALLEKFGPGPHHLEMYVRFDSHLGRDDGGAILIEMAPIDDLPHAVYWFLEQVSRQLFDGYSFHRNPGHVLSVGPVKNFLTKNFFPDEKAKEKRFQEEGFDSILFNEYSYEFPHNSYTLGYSGRPGGPNFYISIKDNSIIHGPGGQGPAAEAETCFAKVIDGFDLVDRISELPTEEGTLIDTTAIEYISIRPN